MNNWKRGAIGAFAGAFSMVALAPVAVHADSTQNNKNLWRNLAIGAGVVAGHGLINHNGTETLLGAAGAAYSANRYEQERKSQSNEQRARREYYRSHSGQSYRHNDRKYYTYQGHQYFYDYKTGHRALVD
jgi:hypothetical protein